MKADVPAPKLVKYGMTAEYQDAIVERHFVVTLTERLHAAQLHQRMLAKLPAVVKLLNRGSAPAATPEPVPVSAEPVPIATPTVPLREALGLD